MWFYFIRRLAIMIPTIVGIMTITFLVTQILPGGPIDHLMSQLDNNGMNAGSENGGGSGWTYSGRRGVDQNQIAQLNKQYEFDQPLLTRYINMIKNYIQLDFGYSYYHSQSVATLIKEKLGVTISIGLWVFFLTYLVSIPLGVAKAVRHGSRFDIITSVFVLTGYAMPGFILGVLLIVLFGGGSFWDIFPLRGLTSDNWDDLTLFGKVTDYLWHITLPLAASVVSVFAIKTILTKNVFLEEIHRQYVLTARAKGLSEKTILWKHILRNSMLPLITGFPITFISIFTGSLLIESLFSLDGIGLLSYESIMNRDYPVVLGTLYLFTMLGLVIKLAADIAYAFADPRIKFSAQDK
jgi:microcin C transport system permease protein